MAQPIDPAMPASRDQLFSAGDDDHTSKVHRVQVWIIFMACPENLWVN
jgi:hypothetical protein